MTETNDIETNNSTVIEADKLTKRYEDGVLALDQVSFTINSSEIFAMLGGNGAGKTTASFTVLPEMLDCDDLYFPFNPCRVRIEYETI